MVIGDPDVPQEASQPGQPPSGESTGLTTDAGFEIPQISLTDPNYNKANKGPTSDPNQAKLKVFCKSPPHSTPIHTHARSCAGL